MRHAEPISDEIIRGVPEKLIASAKIIERVEQTSANGSKSLWYSYPAARKSRIIRSV
jgi:hypothetical protein